MNEKKAAKEAAVALLGLSMARFDLEPVEAAPEAKPAPAQPAKAEPSVVIWAMAALDALVILNLAWTWRLL